MELFTPRYVNKPRYPRIVGGDPGAVARAQGKLLDYSEWMDLCEATQTNETLRKLMNKLVTTYYLIKENK